MLHEEGVANQLCLAGDDGAGLEAEALGVGMRPRWMCVGWSAQVFGEWYGEGFTAEGAGAWWAGRQGGIGA